VDANASDHARQVNIGGDNFGPVYMPGNTMARQLVRQLPFAAPDFSGRDGETELVAAWLAAGPAPRIVNIYGIPGAGKSALAIYLGHRLSDLYPDCQLHFNLRSSDQQPVSTEDLLGGVLMQLGVPAAEIPTGLDLRSSTYRSALAAMRSIVVVDNASTAAQVEPLLPGSAEAAVLITSWAPIPELPGIRTLPLRPLHDDEAVSMLLAVARRECAEAEMPTIRRIAQLAGNLPLALRIAGGLLKARPHWSWRDLAQRLDDRGEAARLDALTSGALAVSTSFDLAYRELDPLTACGYRLLGLAPSAEMSGELAQILVSADPDLAGTIFDDLVTRELLQPTTASTLRMHDLLWQRARKLVNTVEDPAVREAAADRMIAWSLNLLDTQYLPQLRLTLNTVLAMPDTVSGSLPLSEVYVDSPVVDDNRTGSPASLADTFPAHQRLVLVGPGGAGKTTMANYLCDAAARRRVEDRSSPVPIVLLIRDLHQDDEHAGLEHLVTRTLRYRYGMDLTPDALRVALRQGLVFVVVDGLDEIIDPTLRPAVVASIVRFSEIHPRVPMLVTTRPFSTMRTELPGFAFATIAPWTQDLAIRYLSNLAATGRFHVYRDRLRRLLEWCPALWHAGFLNTPLGLQMLLSTYRGGDYLPDSFTKLMESIVENILFRRETIRGTLPLPPQEIQSILELTAFSMQSSPHNRVVITASSIASIVDQIVGNFGMRRRAGDGLVRSLANRIGVLCETGATKGGESLFAFTHTAFREYFASSHLATMSPAEMAYSMETHFSDASWEAVFIAALELAQRRRGQLFPDEVVEAAATQGNQALTNAVSSWRDQIGST
jgi:hypothetical protein